jgi:peptidyl-prolyl cis-trans isomerase SurA
MPKSPGWPSRTVRRRRRLPNFFASKGVNIATLRAQIPGAMAWALVVQRRLRPQVDIGDDEVDAEIARISSSAGQPQYLAAEIFLPVDAPAQEDGVKQTAQRLIEQMARGRALLGSRPPVLAVAQFGVGR